MYGSEIGRENKTSSYPSSNNNVYTLQGECDLTNYGYFDYNHGFAVFGSHQVNGVGTVPDVVYTATAYY